MKNSSYVNLFASCIIVPGFTQSLLCDLQNGVSHFLPNNLYEISKYFKTHTTEEIKEKYDNESILIIEEYINFLIDNNFAFFCSKDELQLFPELSLEWDYPAIISNAIIDLNHNSRIDFNDLFAQLENLGCRDIQIRIYDQFPLSKIENIMNCAENRTIKSIQVFIKYDPNIDTKTYIDFVYRFPRITGFYIHSSDVDEMLDSEQAPALVIAKIKDKLQSSNHCGVIDKLYFATTMELFTESLQHNTCLNRKISIDVEGNIKNCPSMKESYGNISSSSLEDALAKDGFKQYWNIKKDQISVCKDCEFRHICTDCRGFLEDPEDIYSKPLKCGYDPYTGKWSEWSKNPLKQKAIQYYKLNPI